jgi:hypothetical protein
VLAERGRDTRHGHPDPAAHTIENLHTELGVVNSTRIHHELTLLRSQWQPYRTSPAIQPADALIARLNQQHRTAKSARAT